MQILLYPRKQGHEASRPQIPPLRRESIRPSSWPPGWRWVHGAPTSWRSATRRCVNSKPPRKQDGYQLQLLIQLDSSHLRGIIRYPSWCLVLSLLAKHRSLCRTKSSTLDSLAATCPPSFCPSSFLEPTLWWFFQVRTVHAVSVGYCHLFFYFL